MGPGHAPHYADTILSNCCNKGLQKNTEVVIRNAMIKATGRIGLVVNIYTSHRAGYKNCGPGTSVEQVDKNVDNSCEFKTNLRSRCIEMWIMRITS